MLLPSLVFFQKKIFAYLLLASVGTIAIVGISLLTTLTGCILWVISMKYWVLGEI
jgi:hypothetical protein